jgi:hypothetical protein
VCGLWGAHINGVQGENSVKLCQEVSIIVGAVCVCVCMCVMCVVCVCVCVCVCVFVSAFVKCKKFAFGG